MSDDLSKTEKTREIEAVELLFKRFCEKLRAYRDYKDPTNQSFVLPILNYEAENAGDKLQLFSDDENITMNNMNDFIDFMVKQTVHTAQTNCMYGRDMIRKVFKQLFGIEGVA